VALYTEARGAITAHQVRQELVSGTPKYVVIPERRIPAYLRWSCLLYVFSLPFEASNLSLLAGSFSLARISGLLFVGSAMLYYKPLIGERNRLPAIPAAMWWIIAYLAIYALAGFLVEQELYPDVLGRFIALAQLVVVFWITTDLLKNRNMATSALLALSYGCALLAAAILLHIPGFAVVADEERLTALGTNPNTIATLLVLGALTFIGMMINRRSSFTRNILYLCLTLLLIGIIIKTGSRAAIAALVVGLAIYLIPHWRSKRFFTALAVAFGFVAVVLYMAVNNPTMRERWMATYYEGNLAGREKINPAAIEMIGERPFFGWHPVEYRHELSYRLGHWGERDAHNLFLHLLLEVGFVGTVPFLLAVAVCGWGAWKMRTEKLGLLPLALLMTAVAIAMTHSAIYHKPFWLILALTAGARPASVMRLTLLRNRAPLVTT
jgi:O-antigen ligase